MLQRKLSIFILKHGWTAAQTAANSEGERKDLFNDTFYRQHLILLVSDEWI